MFSLKFIIIGIAVLAITSAIGGFFLYQKSIVNDLRETIADKEKTISVQKEQIAGLIIDKEKLTISNASLENEIKRKSDETKEAFAEIERLRKADAESAKRLNEVERLLRDRQRMKRIDAIRKSRKASLLIRLMDKNVKCYAENFDKVTGRCIRGEWVDE